MVPFKYCGGSYVTDYKFSIFRTLLRVHEDIVIRFYLFIVHYRSTETFPIMSSLGLGQLVIGI